MEGGGREKFRIMKYLLDTQILIWILYSPSRISSKNRYLIDNAESLFVSTLSIFEILHKKKIGKLEFEYDLEEFEFFEWLDLKRDHILYTNDLPLSHRDPFDRLIMAQSIIESIPLITSDKKIQQYDFPHVKA